MEAEVVKLKLNADNLAVCLHALLKRVEHLEGSASPNQREDNLSVINTNYRRKTTDDALNGILNRREGSYNSECEPDEKVTFNEMISTDPETGLKKRTTVTERVLTTKTFHAIAVEDNPPQDTGHLSLPMHQPRTILLKSNPSRDIKFHRHYGAFFVTKVSPKSQFAKDLHCGDAIIEINDQPAYQIKDFNSLSGPIKLKTVAIPIHQAPSIFYRAVADYDTSSDKNLKQTWTALDLKKGEVIQVLSQDDKWMQARKVNDTSKVGLLPVNFASERVAMLTPYGRRVIALIGASGVGRRTLKSMLLSFMPQYFATVTPFTSRAPRPHEEEGREYYFRTKAEITEKIKKGEMIEWGELDNHLYGTSRESVRDCVRGGRVCVLDCAPQALSHLYNKEFMPFVVVITPPDLHDSKQLDKERANPRTENQLIATIQESKALLSGEFAKLFHLIIPNRNIDITFRRLLDALSQLKSEIQWVPEKWLCI